MTPIEFVNWLRSYTTTAPGLSESADIEVIKKALASVVDEPKVATSL
ncbi:MAG: hypothetical protein RBJ76_13105 [Stenomitos frigidus ULC029]